MAFSCLDRHNFFMSARLGNSETRQKARLILLVLRMTNAGLSTEKYENQKSNLWQVEAYRADSVSVITKSWICGRSSVGGYTRFNIGVGGVVE